MSFLLQPLQIVVAVLSELVRKEQAKVIEYLQLENRILRETMGSNRVLLSDDQRRRLAVKGKALGRQALGKIATVAQADTVFRWHRELVETNRYTNTSQNTGRPRTDKDVVELVLRMARENASWGYKRIEGALQNVVYRVCSSTVANILKQHGIEPAPQRERQLSWSTFLKAHKEAFQEVDFRDAFPWLNEISSLLPTLAGIIQRAWTECETPSTEDLCPIGDDAVSYRVRQTEYAGVPYAGVLGKLFAMNHKYSRQLIRPPPISSVAANRVIHRFGSRAA